MYAVNIFTTSFCSGFAKVFKDAAKKRMKKLVFWYIHFIRNQAGLTSQIKHSEIVLQTFEAERSHVHDHAVFCHS